MKYKLLINYVTDLIGRIIEKGENAGYQQFLLFPAWFWKLPFAAERVETFFGKGENAGYQHFLLSHNIFGNLAICIYKTDLFGQA